LGAIDIVKIIEKTNSSVVLHCSDGWDRTAQLSSLVQLMIDPFFRTLKGLIILIEKEWCSFGHKFAQRGGHEISEKKKSNEKSPIFIQWLDSVWQLMLQFPEAFQFNEEFLICLADALYECRFGTFLEDTEKARKENCQPYAVSLWTWVNLEENKSQYINPLYNPNITEVLWPTCSTRSIHLWENYWLRWDPDFRPMSLSRLITKALKNSNQNTST